MKPLERYEEFKDSISRQFVVEILWLVEDIRDLFDLLKEEDGSEEFIITTDEGDNVNIKIKPAKPSNKHLFFNNIEDFSLDVFDKSIIITDHLFHNNSFMCATNKSGDFIFSKMDLDGESSYLHIKNDEKAIVSGDYQQFDYVLFILGVILESVYEYE